MYRPALARDLALVMDRRRALAAVAAGMGGALAAACSGKAEAAGESACLVTPTEIRGPYPADGTNGRPQRINVLDLDDVVRRDIRSSFAGLQGTAEGVAVELELRLVSAIGCVPLAGRALYLWQNDAAGEYSLYTMPQANYLRGVQVSDAQGRVRFTAIVPGCYGGRAPHCHFEVYQSLGAARAGERPLLVSQLAYSEAACRAVYTGDPRYGGSLENLQRWTPARDFVFGDAGAEGLAAQTLVLSGDPTRGYHCAAVVTLG